MITRNYDQQRGCVNGVEVVLAGMRSHSITVRMPGGELVVLPRINCIIGQDESGDDDAGVFLVRPGDENGDTYTAFNHSDLEGLSESTLGTVISWPEVVNKINSAMKATGWKGQRQSDDAFMFSTKGQLDDEFYIVIIENAGEGFFTYALGTVEDGDPYIDDAYKGKLPNTEASVSELINDIRDGFGLNEGKQKGVDGKACWKGYKRMGTKQKGGKTVDNCVPTGKK
jgi:hypothetical protein